MKGDNVHILTGHLIDRPVPVRHVPVRTAMESVTPDPVTVVVLIWDRVKVCLFGKCLVECGIENRDLRYALAQQFLTRRYPTEICGVMQRRQFNAVLNPLNHFFCDQVRALELLASVHDAVPDRTDLR